jgi:hypothetical protein
VLFVTTGSVWLLSAGLAIHAAVSQSFISRTGVMFALAVATALTTATLVWVFVAPLERVYRHGYEAGLRSHVPQSDARVVGDVPAVVIPFKARRGAQRIDC